MARCNEGSRLAKVLAAIMLAREGDDPCSEHGRGPQCDPSWKQSSQPFHSITVLVPRENPLPNTSVLEAWHLRPGALFQGEGALPEDAAVGGLAQLRAQKGPAGGVGCRVLGGFGGDEQGLELSLGTDEGSACGLDAVLRSRLVPHSQGPQKSPPGSAALHAV